MLVKCLFLPPATKLGQGYIFTGVWGCLLLVGCLLLGGVWSQGSGPGGCLVPGGVWSRGMPGGDPPGTATAAGGTHPTGMHSCLLNFFLCRNGIFHRDVKPENILVRVSHLNHGGRPRQAHPSPEPNIS